MWKLSNSSHKKTQVIIQHYSSQELMWTESFTVHQSSVEFDELIVKIQLPSLGLF